MDFRSDRVVVEMTFNVDCEIRRKMKKKRGIMIS